MLKYNFPASLSLIYDYESLRRIDIRLKMVNMITFHMIMLTNLRSLKKGNLWLVNYTDSLDLLGKSSNRDIHVSTYK